MMELYISAFSILAATVAVICAVRVVRTERRAGQSRKIQTEKFSSRESVTRAWADTEPMPHCCELDDHRAQAVLDSLLKGTDFSLQCDQGKTSMNDRDVWGRIDRRS